ncbi:methylmalonyl Co-A mutase-associated GTPase MeaB [Jeotgalibacillus sp. R-1-5s-1]|uniref:methylmalonyl Co-A mutase-associated GTPase MeaB n=1 Tax=Jeotgalibacillus sp. R-1-5s-1 TaxID=2555897 RepID=UPI001FC87F7F|nr:methylmalonyl Co-A mutase-associated GTPase MeaB [Jeotgalibacillus sp. R-1-5s-1]
MTKAKRTFRRKKEESIHIPEIAERIRNGDRSALSKGITLIESKNGFHRRLASELINVLLPYTGNSIRIGITGVPGAGKSTWIETFGSNVVQKGKRIAVLAIDPSSSRSGGSILGDKTRMETLSNHPDVFIRPSPSAGTLGGVARMTRETMLLCEAAGYDLILVETVGVGQSEGMVRGMVDFFLLLTLTGAGDELQGMKKGIMELVDAIVINKADGQNEQPAQKTRNEFSQLLHFLTPATEGWKPEAYTCSALLNKGILELWQLVTEFDKQMKQSGQFEKRRREQSVDWMNQMLLDRLYDHFLSMENRKERLKEYERLVRDHQMSPTEAVDRLFEE